MAPLMRLSSRSTLINKILVMVSGASVGRAMTGRRVVVADGSSEADVVGLRVTLTARVALAVADGMEVDVASSVGDRTSVVTGVAAWVAVMVGRGVRVGAVGVSVGEQAAPIITIRIKIEKV